MARIMLFILLSHLIGGCASINTETMFRDAKEVDLDRVLSAELDEEFQGDAGLSAEGCSFLFPQKNPESCLPDWESVRNFNRLDYLRTYGSLAARSMLQANRAENFFNTYQEENPNSTDEELALAFDEFFAEGRMYDCIQEVVLEQDVSPDVCVFLFGELASPDEVRDTMERLERRMVATVPSPDPIVVSALLHRIQAPTTMGIPQSVRRVEIRAQHHALQSLRR